MALGLALLPGPQAALSQPLPGTVDLSFDAGSALVGQVRASAELPDGTVLIAGTFRSVNGAAAVGVAKLLPNGETDTEFTTNALRWTVSGMTIDNVLEWGIRPTGLAVAVQIDGKVLVGGAFSNPDYGFSCGVIRLNADGTWDDTFPRLSTTVYALAVQSDRKILVGGTFGLKRLSPDGSPDPTFLYGVSGPNGAVYAIEVLENGQIMIGGSFSTVNDSPRTRIARLTPDGSVDATFSASLSSSVTSIAVQPDGKMIIGGYFTSVNGVDRGGLARLNTDGSLDTSFLPETSGNVVKVSLQSDGKILVGGSFSINGNQKYLARLNSDGSEDSSFWAGTAGLDQVAYTISPQADGRILIGGAFDSIGDVVQPRIARLLAYGSVDSTFTNGPVLFKGSVSSLAVQSDGKILANAVASTGIGRFQTNGAPDSSFLNGLAGANGTVNAIAVIPGGKILAAGEFSQFNGSAAQAIVRLETSGALDLSFRQGIGGTGTINCLKVQADGKILIGGTFNQVKGAARTNLARLNPDGSLDANFLGNQAGVNGEVLSLALQPDDKILVGGSYTEVNGAPRTNIARLNPDGSLDRSFQEGMTGVDGPVYTLTVQPDLNVLVSGRFNYANGFLNQGVVRLMPDGSADTNFFLDYTDLGTPDVRALALQQDGRMLIGGNILFLSWNFVNYIARLQSTGPCEGFMNRPMGADAPVTALLILDDTRVLVGGGFGTINGAPRSHLACLVYDAPTVPLDLALGDSGLTWTNQGEVAWFGQTGISHDGVAAAQSGAISTSQSSRLITTVTGPGCLSFWWKVSSEEYYDFLTFSCTGPGLNTQLDISGEVDWEPQMLCVPEGVYTLSWTYSKDWGWSRGRDAGWVDEVTYTHGNLPPIITRSPDGSTNEPGDSVAFSAEAIGTGPLSYQWLFNGTEVPDATNATFIISSLVPEQSGAYSVRISNPYGASFSAAAQLTVFPVRALGANEYGQATFPTSVTDAAAIAAGQFHSIVLKHDGSISAWGNDGFGQCAVPAGLGPALGIAAGGYHSLAIKSDTTVAGWGDDSLGQATPPPGLSNVLAVAAGLWHSLALKEDGTVVGWGDNSYGQASPPAGLSNIVAIAAGSTHSLALRADGRVFGWGGNLGPLGSYAGQAAVPWGLENVVAIGAGAYHSLAVKNDGTIVGWGDNSWGQLNVPTNLPPAVTIAGGGAHTVAVLADGTAAAWGENFNSQCDISRTLTNVIAAAAGQAHTLLLFGQRSSVPELRQPVWAEGHFSVQVQTWSGKFYALEYTDSLGAPNWTSLPPVHGTGSVMTLTDSAASTSRRFYRVRQW